MTLRVSDAEHGRRPVSRLRETEAKRSAEQRGARRPGLAAGRRPNKYPLMQSYTYLLTENVANYDARYTKAQ